MCYFFIIYTKNWTCIIFAKFMHNFFKQKNPDIHNICIIDMMHKSYSGKFGKYYVDSYFFLILCLLIFMYNLLRII